MTSFLLRTPFCRITLAVIIGILLFSNTENLNLLLALYSVGILCLIANYFLQKKNILYYTRWMFGGGILLIFISIGMFISLLQQEKDHFTNIDKQGVFQAKVIGAPTNKAKTYLVKVKTTAFAPDSLHFIATQGNAILYLPKTKTAQSLRIGDKVLFSAKLNPPKQNNNPEEFNYAKYLAQKGFGATSYIDSTHWQLVERNSSFSIYQFSADLRNKLLNTYKAQQINGDEFAVLAALTLGYKDEIKDELQTSYSNSGAMHILSVSGLHVGIIYLVFMFSLSFLNKTKHTRILKSILIIALLWGYALITGLSPSVSRATIMFTIVALANAINVKSQIYNTVFFSAFLLLLYNPNYIFDVGFLLSYSAVLSIVFFQPLIKNLMSFKNKALNWSWELFSVSVAAQIGTLPFALFFFHKFSNYFLLTNFIAIPISTGIIHLALLLFILSPISAVSYWIGLTLNWLLKIQNYCISFIDKIPHSISRIWLNELEVFLLFSIIFFASAVIIKKQFKFISITLTGIIALQISFLYSDFKTKKIDTVIVYANPKFTSVDFIDNNSHYYYTTDSVNSLKMTENFWLKNNLSDPKPIKQSCNYKNGFFSFRGKTFCIITDSNYKYKKNLEKLRIDYLILGGKSKLKIDDIDQLFLTKNIIIDNTISVWQTNNWKTACEKRSINCYPLKEIGCFTLKL